MSFTFLTPGAGVNWQALAACIYGLGIDPIISFPCKPTSFLLSVFLPQRTRHLLPASLYFLSDLHNEGQLPAVCCLSKDLIMPAFT